jgi:hypothetical protein
MEIVKKFGPYLILEALLPGGTLLAVPSTFTGIEKFSSA